MGQQLSVQLQQAASAGDVEALDRLLEGGADVTAAEKVLREVLAAFKYRPASVQLALTAVTEAQEGSWTALHFAAWGGHERAVRELLVRGATVNARDAEHKTALHLAVLGGHEATAQALCDHGADVKAAAADGQTPLHKAAVQDHLVLVQELVARGAVVGAKLQDGSTPAHLAAWKGHARILSYLLESGADPNSRTEAGETVLHEAAKAGEEVCCRLLLRHGANRAALDAESRTPADTALLQGYTAAAEMIRPTDRELAAGAAIKRLQAAGSPPHASPSAPIWNDGPINYPVVDFPQQPAAPLPSRQPTAAVPLDAPVPSGRGRSRSSEMDWEGAQDEDEDWEGVPPVSMVPSRGSQLMEASGQNPAGHPDPGIFWMVPEPIRWAAASLGGMLGGMNPWRSQEAAHPPDEQAMETELEAREAEVAHLSEPKTKEQLNEAQLSRLQQQEAEIAELRRRLGEGQHGAAEPSTIEGSSSRERHRIIRRLPDIPKPACREVSRQTLHDATSSFDEANVILRDAHSTWYRGLIQGSPVVVSIPTTPGAVPWHVLQPAADRLANVASELVLPLRGISRDGSAVFDHPPNGSIEDALRSRAPGPGRAPVRLDWPARAAIAADMARGLANLHDAQPPILHAALRPGQVLLTDALRARLAPPSATGLALGFQAGQAEAAFSAPEVRRGEPPSPESDVFSLGVLLMQLLTGSEPSGLRSYLASATEGDQLGEVLDPCAEGMQAQAALPIAQLALRCTAFHAEDRPNLQQEILPILQQVSDAARSAPPAAAARSRASAPPAHLICPVTKEVMTNPVILADGHTYEESAARQLLQGERPVSPVTDAPLAHRDMVPNFAVQSAAMAWRQGTTPDVQQRLIAPLTSAKRPGPDVASLPENAARRFRKSEEEPRITEPQQPGTEPQQMATGSVIDLCSEDELPSVPTGAAAEEAVRAHLLLEGSRGRRAAAREPAEALREG